MTLKVDIVSQSARTSAGTQAFTSNVFNGDIKAYVIWANHAVTNGGLATPGSISVGFCDKTNQGAMFGYVEHNNSTTPLVRSSVRTDSLLYLLTNGGSVRLQAAHSSTQTNGITINYTTAPASLPELITVMMIGGDVEASVISALFNGTPDNADRAVAHNLSAAPEFIWTLAHRNSSYNALVSSYIFNSGFWSAGAQTGSGLQMQTAVVPTNIGGIVTSGKSTRSINTTPADDGTGITISAVGATTFTVGTNTSNHAPLFLCLRGTTSALSVKTGLATTRTTVGSSTLTGVTGRPSIALFLPTSLTSTAFSSTDGGYVWGFGAAVDTGSGTESQVNVAAIRDNTGITESRSWADAKPLTVLDQAGGEVVNSTLTSWDTGGITLNFGLVNGTAYEYQYALLAQNAPSITTIGSPVVGSSFTITGNGFSASGNTVTIGGVAQTVTAEGVTSITCTAVLGGLLYGVAYPVVVTNGSGVADASNQHVSMQPNATTEYVTLQGPFVPVGQRLSSTPDLQDGWQIELSNVTNGFTIADVQLYSDGEWIATPGTYAFSIRINNTVDGWSTSAVQTLAAAAPTITAQPVNASVTEPATAGFSITATGTGNTYQWYRNGVSIGGATSSSYTTPATSIADNNTGFYCIVTNGQGSLQSSTARMFVSAQASTIGGPRSSKTEVTLEAKAKSVLTVKTTDIAGNVVFKTIQLD